MYHLQAEFAPHGSDVKAVAFVDERRVVSASRDGTVLLNWVPELGSDASGQPEPIFRTECFVNSIAVDRTQQRVFAGCQDGQIAGIDLLDQADPLLYLGHTANVANLQFGAAGLVSGSWDSTARTWDASHPGVSSVLGAGNEGHNGAVWAVQGVDTNVVLTGGADGNIFLWRDGKVALKYKPHSGPVRGLALIGRSKFATASNDGTTRIYAIGEADPVHTLKAHTSFVYTVAYAPDCNLLATAGEDRTVRIWDLASMELVQTIDLPAVSAWTVAFAPETETAEAGSSSAKPKLPAIAVGTSDCRTRVFSVLANAKAKVARAFEQALADCVIGQDQMAVPDRSALADQSVLETPGYESQLVLIEDRAVIKAYRFTCGRWLCVGKLGATSSDGAKINYNGKDYDYVFDVDVRDGEPPLKLPFNRGDNIYATASKFLADNGLPASYEEQVVRFILDSTAGKEIGQSAGSQPGSQPGSQAAATTNAPRSQILAGLKPVAMISFAAEPCARAWAAAARSAGSGPGNSSGSGTLPDDISGLLQSLPSSAEELLPLALEAGKSWPVDDLLPALDVLRLALFHARKIPIAETASLLIRCADPGLPKYAMLALRGLANLAAGPCGEQQVRQNSSLFASALALACSTDSPVSPAYVLASTTLVLNLSIQGFEPSLASTFTWLFKQKHDSESRYRLCLAVGLRKDRGDERKAIEPVKSMLAQPEERLRKLAAEIDL